MEDIDKLIKTLTYAAITTLVLGALVVYTNKPKNKKEELDSFSGACGCGK